MTSAETLFWPQEQWRELQCRQLAEHLRHAAGSGLYKGVAGVLEEARRKRRLGEGMLTNCWRDCR